MYRCTVGYSQHEGLLMLMQPPNGRNLLSPKTQAAAEYRMRFEEFLFEEFCILCKRLLILAWSTMQTAVPCQSAYIFKLWCAYSSLPTALDKRNFIVATNSSSLENSVPIINSTLRCVHCDQTTCPDPHQ